MQSHVCVSVLYMTKPLGYRIKIYSIFLVDFERSAGHSYATIGMLDKPIRSVTRCINIGHHDRVQFAIAQIVTCQYDGVILFKVADASQGNGISEEIQPSALSWYVSLMVSSKSSPHTLTTRPYPL